MSAVAAAGPCERDDIKVFSIVLHVFSGEDVKSSHVEHWLDQHRFDHGPLDLALGEF